MNWIADAIRKYSPDQPRDEKGRFGSDGGGMVPGHVHATNVAWLQRNLIDVKNRIARAQVLAGKGKHLEAVSVLRSK